MQFHLFALFTDDDNSVGASDEVKKTIMVNVLQLDEQLHYG